MLPMATRRACPLCQDEASEFTIVDHVLYFECRVCDFIFADPSLLERVDRGEPLRRYDEEYWQNELASARDRSYGSSLARCAEAILYCRVPIQRFIDVGTGPGILLEALSLYLPDHADKLFGVEKFPPREEERSKHPNYHCADLKDLGLTFECGVCIEVLEHLTPQMACGLAAAMRVASVPGSLFMFNTGLTDYVRCEDPGYLDPYGRGHITCWSVKAAQRVFAAEGFVVHPVPGKSWAFVIERPLGEVGQEIAIGDRIWSAPSANLALLADSRMGTVMQILGRESARAY
jgi:hypothetical protein